MSRFVIATMPIPGHVAPMAPVARTLVERGHDVVWYSSAFFAAEIRRTGADFRPLRTPLDFGDADYNRHFPGRERLSGLKRIVFDFEHVFVGSIEGYVTDLRAIIAERPTDVLLVDPAVSAGWVLDETDGIPTAILNVTVLGLESPDIPPFGLGLGPAKGSWGRLRNRLLYWLTDHVVFRPVNAAAREVAARNGWTFHPMRPRATRWLYLQPSVPELEYRDSRLGPQVHFIGPLLPEPAPVFDKPGWWVDVETAHRNGTPVVLVTQGTIATDSTELIRPTLEALAGRDMLVIAAGADPALFADIPANARVSPFVPFTEIMPMVSVFVTNGGFGGVAIALANGVALVVAGTTEDKPEVGARVAHAGVGVDLRTNRPTPSRVAAAVESVLTDRYIRERAERIARRFATHNAPVEAATLLEELATTRQPVIGLRHRQLRIDVDV